MMSARQALTTAVAAAAVAMAGVGFSGFPEHPGGSDQDCSGPQMMDPDCSYAGPWGPDGDSGYWGPGMGMMGPGMMHGGGWDYPHS